MENMENCTGVLNAMESAESDLVKIFFSKFTFELQMIDLYGYDLIGTLKIKESSNPNDIDCINNILDKIDLCLSNVDYSKNGNIVKEFKLTIDIDKKFSFNVFKSYLSIFGIEYFTLTEYTILYMERIKAQYHLLVRIQDGL